MQVDEEVLNTLWEIAREIGKGETIASDGMGGTYCLFCNGDPDYSDTNNFYHEPTCIVMKANALTERK
jgi:hypothetical protein